MKRSVNANAHQRPRRWFKLFTFLVSLVCFGYFWTSEARVVDSADPIAEPSLVETQDKDYSRFTHSNAFHSRMPCLLCHRRDTNSPRVSFPGKAGHTPCIGCHSLQFSDNSSPICTICHTNSQTGAMKRFPGLRSFGRRFNHSRHSRVNCAVCHKSTQRGVALSIPAGANGHATCFQCHTASSSFSMSSCSVCHQPGRLVRTPETAAAYRINFSHARHSREGLSCSSCHSVRGGGTGRQVTKPLASMHFAPPNAASCAACHNGKRAFGANEFANCKRCHTGNSFRF
jgi:c(7)-type cytochrome triheme protein